MREILFRGKRTDNGEWVYGSYAIATHKYSYKQANEPHKSWIITRAHGNGGWFTTVVRFPVIDETVGQLTGMKDLNGTPIFEGDIVANHLDPKEPERETRGAILWDDKFHGWGYLEFGRAYQDELDDVSGIDGQWEVVDNIFDNAECYWKIANKQTE